MIPGYTMFGLARALLIEGKPYVYLDDLGEWARVPDQPTTHEVWAKPLPETETLTPGRIHTMMLQGVRVEVAR